MKPIRLVIEGINSFTDAQTLDFEAVGRTNLFCICGKTGAGKSTVFDSIMLALYGKSGRGNLADMVNLSRMTARVVFEFSEGADVYTVERTLKCTHEKNDKGEPTDKRVASSEVTITKNGAAFAKGKDAVGFVEDLIGLEANEFKNVYLLEQGEYAEFLKKTPQEQTKVVGKIFSLMRFADIHKLAKDKMQATDSDIQSLDGVLATYEDVSQERLDSEKKELAALKSKTTVLRKDEQKQAEELAALQKARDEFISVREKQNAVKNLMLQADEAKKRKYLAETELADFEKTVDRSLEPKIADLRKTLNELAALNALDREYAAAVKDAAAKKTALSPDDKRQMNKRTLIRKGYIQESVDEERMGTRKLKNKKVAKVVPFAPIKIENAVITTENLTVKILSEKIGKTAQEIIKQLMELGIMTTINSVVDFPTMQLVADALGVNIELKLEKTKEEQLQDLHSEPDPEDSLVKRPPIITVMGHVDHGKTSLLDAIRKTSVVSGEAGGITQHIGAYSVDVNGEKITFLDTPGHEAFTEMRKRGATVTDIAVLIVAADDGVMPQTVEAIKHAKAAGVPIVVAMNKIDKQGANPERIKQQLAEHDVVCEEWGGDVPMIPISAKQNIGIDKLLENIILQAEVLELRANPDRSARGYVIEARLDKGKGPIATVIVQNGTLKVGDYIVSGTTYGRVRSLTDDKGANIKSAGPSMPVAVYGLAQVPSAGDPIAVVESEKMARQVIEERAARAKNEMLSDLPTTDLDDAFGKHAGDKDKEFRVLIKADVQGSSEALKEAVQNLSGDEIKVNVVYAGVGAINQSDIMMAEVSHASIIGFNVKPDNDARNAAERAGIPIKLFGIIYEALDYVQSKTEEMLAPKFVEHVTGRAIVRTMFKVSGVGIVAGSYVQTGKIVRSGKARLFRGGKLIHEGNIVGLKRYKDDAKEVTIGLECGIAIADCAEYLEDDEIECYVVEKESK